MECFRYTARGIDGRRRVGEVTAFTLEEATDRLQEVGVYVTSISPIHHQAWHSRGRATLSDQERIFLLESWTILLEAGLPINASILQLRMKTNNRSLAAALDQVEQAIQGGATFTEALRLSRIFPPSWVAVFVGSERRGDFIQPMKMLHRYAVELARFKRQLLSMMISPAILLALLLVWLWIISVRVLPSFGLLVGAMGSGGAPPFWVTTLPGILVSTVAWGIVGIVGIFLVSRWLRQADQELGLVSAWLPPWIPLIGPLVCQMQMIVVTSGLGLQLKSGIPLMEALETMSRGVHSRWLRRQLLQAYGKLQEGLPVSTALFCLTEIPSHGQSLLAAGDTSGKLPDMFELLAEEIQVTLLERIKRLIIWIRSSVILFTGLLVGFLVVLFFGLFFSSVTQISQQNVTSPRLLSSL